MLRHCFKLSLIPLKFVEPILKLALEFLKAELRKSVVSSGTHFNILALASHRCSQLHWP